jgi:pimeloyl-ACP methyl ester carboxylesterase
LATDGRVQSEVVEANGQQLHVVSAGEGPLVLLLHGFPETWYSWRHQLPALADAGYRAVAFDMRGYGGSSKPGRVEDYAITDLVADGKALVRALGAPRAAVVGHDWGAPIAWTAAWTEPDVFHAVAALSVPFAGRGITALPGDPFGERRPGETYRELSGPDRVFYQEYFSIPGAMEEEAAKDVRAFLASIFYSLSASPPLPDALAGADLSALPDEVLRAVVGGAMCFDRTAGLASVLAAPPSLPDWLSAEDLDHYAQAFASGGLTGPLSYYRNIERDWELLEPYAGRTLDGPSLFIGGDRDIVTIWSREARERAPELRTDMRDDVILSGCGHWVQQERPAETNVALIDFLDGVG